MDRPHLGCGQFLGENLQGLSHYVLNNCATGSPVEDKFLPEYLKDAGYMNYHVGKWHLGFCSWSHTPTRRGFDRSYGSFGGGMQ